MNTLVIEKIKISNDALITVRNLKKSFGGVMAINDLNLDVQKEKITGLIGPNGSGKTTTFSIISGMTTADQGEVTLNGELITGLRPFQISNKGLLRTFQLTRIFSKMTVLENLTVRDGFRAGFNDQLLWDLIEIVGLTNNLNDMAGTLSFGQQKLLELVRAACRKPVAMLLDEPFAGVNETMERNLVSLIRHLQNERQCSFILIDHEMRLMMELCDYIYVMSNGSLIFEGVPNAVKSDQRTKEAYFGKGKIGATPI